MSTDNDNDLKKTEELFALLQGELPDGCNITRSNRPKLTADQAWTVIWWLGNQYWQVTDRVDRCDVCGSLYNSCQEGHCLDFGRAPYNFCDSCMQTEAFTKKQSSKANPNRPTE